MYTCQPFFVPVSRIVSRVIKGLIEIKNNKKKRLYISDHFRKTALKYPDKVAIVFEDRQLTFRDVDNLSNRIANVLRNSGLHRGNTAAIFMDNCLEYLPVFLAMSKLGVTGKWAWLVKVDPMKNNQLCSCFDQLQPS